MMTECSTGEKQVHPSDPRYRVTRQAHSQSVFCGDYAASAWVRYPFNRNDAHSVADSERPVKVWREQHAEWLTLRAPSSEQTRRRRGDVK